MTTIEMGMHTPRIPFDGSDPSDGTAKTRENIRDVFYRLMNVEEFPSFIPAAYDIAINGLTSGFYSEPSTDTSRSDIEQLVSHMKDRFPDPLRPEASSDLARYQALHLLTQYMPTAFVDGCWLRGGARVAMAHTHMGAELSRLYLHQLSGPPEQAQRHPIEKYRHILRDLGLEFENVSSPDFSREPRFIPATFRLPIFLMSMGQFTRNLYAEILGVNLAWHMTGMSALGHNLARFVSEAFGLKMVDTATDYPNYLATSRRLATEAILRLLASYEDRVETAGVLARISKGAWATVTIAQDWIQSVHRAAPPGIADPHDEMMDMISRKASHACGYHGNKRLGEHRIDSQLEGFDGKLLNALATSQWIKPGAPERSPFLTRLIGPRGPMIGVFAPNEQRTIANWIRNLSPDTTHSKVDPILRRLPEIEIECRCWAPEVFRKRAAKAHNRNTVRQLYYHLVNIETHPEVLPAAERFAVRRLSRAMATLDSGQRPIPSLHYDPAALDHWVEKKHREQLDSYRPLSARPQVPKSAFIEATVQLAPLILIDGGWLQGVTSPALIHTPVGQMLLHVFVEEIGEGVAAEHHANIYRDLLGAMGVTAPPVDSLEFSRWSRLDDESFEIPTFWLAISCFPRHFLPEILGLNLAVELAGVGGPYMEARDTLRSFHYPTRFVDVHNAADNISAGHSAWAVNAIKRHMSEIVEREGPHNVDQTWHRIWAGVRATLPMAGATCDIANRLRRLNFRRRAWQVPLIFPA